LLREYALVVDLVYRASGPTRLLDAAREAGARVVDGLDVRVEQGALSLESWIGQPAPRETMLSAARAG
jgi:shikimate dehydrogenase